MTVDLNTLAVQYVLGELTEAGVQEFESRLEVDQAAREALADAVLLMDAVHQLPRATHLAAVAPLRTTRRSRLVTIVSCAAAGLAVVALLKSPVRDGFVAQRSNGEATAIVGTWSDLSEEAVTTEFESDSRDDSDGDVPDWMVAAVLDADESAPRSEGTL